MKKDVLLNKSSMYYIPTILKLIFHQNVNVFAFCVAVTNMLISKTPSVPNANAQIRVTFSHSA